jgi:ribonuclease R
MLPHDLESTITSLFTETGREMLRLNEIAKELEIPSDHSDYEVLKDTLLGMADEGILEKHTRRRYSMKGFEDTSEYSGTVIFNNHKAYVKTANQNIKNIYIRQNNLNTALPGDTVTAVLHAVKKEKKSRKFRGEVIRIEKRNRNRIVGIVEYDGMFYFLVPDDPDFYVDFLIPEKELNGAKVGDKVSSTLLHWKDPQKNPVVGDLEILGAAGAISVEFDSIPLEFDLSESFPDNVEKEASKIKAPTNRAIKSRFDLRDDYIVTIDPPDAKDFDDALSLKILDNGNYYLGVHIADVSHYVEEGSALDEEALRRGNSTYLVDRVVPMLPESLSNNICSLKPNEVRYTMTCFMEITPSGNVVNYDIGRGIIKSKRRYTYDEVLDIISNADTNDSTPESEFIIKLNKLATILRAKRFKKAGIEFETSEFRFELDEDRIPFRAYKKWGNAATSLVEECMLVCNRTVTDFVYDKTAEMNRTQVLPFLFRVHDMPDGVKLKDTLKYLGKIVNGIDLKAFSSKSLNKVIKLFEGMPEKDVAHTLLIRTMAKAEYSSKNIGHFGLGFENYAHFTSPIRRYPDLVVHRLINLYLEDKPSKKKIAEYKETLNSIGKHCTDTERNSMIAERSSNKLAFSLLAHEHVDEVFTGTVTGVAGYGLYIELDEIHCEGLLHIKNMWDDYYYYEEEKFCLYGKRKKHTYRFGDKLAVRITNVNIDRREIDFELVK